VIEDAAYQFACVLRASAVARVSAQIERKGDINACRTLYCGTLSQKTLAPGLRVGWVLWRGGG